MKGEVHSAKSVEVRLATEGNFLLGKSLGHMQDWRVTHIT